MTISLVVLVLTAWILASAVVCIIVCANASRFSRREEEAIARGQGPRARLPLRGYGPTPMPRESGMQPVKVKLQ